jgi:hypothetical protein
MEALKKIIGEEIEKIVSNLNEIKRLLNEDSSTVAYGNEPPENPPNEKKAVGKVSSLKNLLTLPFIDKCLVFAILLATFISTNWWWPSFFSIVFIFAMSCFVAGLLYLSYQSCTDKKFNEKHFFKEDGGFSFLLKGVFIPILVGFIALMVSENINPKKIPVNIVLGGAYSGFQAAYKSEFKDDFLEPAIKSLGDYEKTLALNVIEVGPYDQILADVTTGKADIASLPPFAYIFYNWYFSDIDTHSFNPVSKTKVVGYKNTSQRGNFYKAGLLFNKSKNDDFVGETAAKIIAKVNTEKGKVIFSNESLSTSGNHIAKTWLMSQGCTDLWVNGTKVASSEMLEALCYTNHPDSNTCTNKPYEVGFFSSDQWDILKRYDPQEAKKFNWVPIPDLPIPYEPILVNKEDWDRKFDSGWQRLWDMLTLRKLDFRKSRKEIILESLQSFMTPIQKESEWLKHNRVFANVLRSGVADEIVTGSNSVYVWFPVSEDSDSRRVSYDDSELKNSIFCFYQLDKNPAYNRFDKGSTLKYPKTPKSESCIELEFKAVSETPTLDKGVVRYEFSFDEKYRSQISKYVNERWYIIPDVFSTWASIPRNWFSCSKLLPGQHDK